MELKSLTRPVILGLSAFIIGGSLLYANYLARQLEQKEQALVRLYADALKFTALNDWDSPDGSYAALQFIQGKLLQENDPQVPKILVGENNRIDSYLGPGLTGPDPTRNKERATKMLEEMKKGYPPIKIEFAEGRFQYVYYGESALLQQLRWFPLAQMLVALTFIAAVFVGFASAKRNEQNRVWVGLAKETAHQLGTPVSSLMAWIELMKDRGFARPGDEEAVDEMEHDVRRLERIAERFSKIGSKPELTELNLRELLQRSADYLRKRMTQRGSVELTVNSHLPASSMLKANPLLIDWVIENLLKNALDALHGSEGKILLEAGERGGFYYIDVTDTGKGIPKANFKKVFEPGFTTKRRGWGLGLSLSRRIVEDYHMGKIFVKYSEVDKGTTFRVLLPRQGGSTKSFSLFRPQKANHVKS